MSEREPLRKYYNDTYGVEVHFCFGWTEAQFKSHMKRHHDYEPVFEDLAGIMIHKGNDVVIWVRHKLPHWVAHEALHATNHILNRAQVGVTLENDEAQAYLLTAIMRAAYGIGTSN